MRLEIPFGKDEVQTLSIPDENLLEVIRPNQVDSAEDLVELEHALDHPISAPLIEDFFDKGDVLIIVNDGTRPTPTAKMLEVLSRRVRLSKATFLVATGAHRAPTKDEMEMIFGRFLSSLQGSIHIHDCRLSPTYHLVTSREGTEIRVNELVKEHDRILIMTSVEPHYFAGYTGGRKSILPGVCAYATIEQNHRLALRPQAKSLVLQGNPVHEDMMDCLNALQDKTILGLQAVLDRHHSIYRAAFGEVNASFARAVQWADDVFVVKAKAKADIVISIASYPMDVDLYQSQKAMENASNILKDGGALILVSKCRQGIGEERFYHLLSKAIDADHLRSKVETEYCLGDHKAVKMADMGKRARICAVTSLADDALRRIRLEPFHSVQEALDDALSRNGEARVTVIFDGSVVVPRAV
ncbi:MAG: nickel-dependent lactate racemase [Methanomassiliicoccales archaeon]